MATKGDFTEDEWKAMQKGLIGSGLLVALSDPDFTDSFGEVSSIAKYLAEQHSSGASELPSAWPSAQRPRRAGSNRRRRRRSSGSAGRSAEAVRRLFSP
jgi:hypothetical protein